MITMLVIVFVANRKKQVSNDAVLSDIVDDIINSGDIRGKIVVDSSTVHPDTTKTLATKLGAVGASFVAAPVFGASPMAKAGKLIFCIAGPVAAKEAIQPYLKDVMGKSVIDLGEEPSKASLLKISGQVFPYLQDTYYPTVDP